ncbi:MAG TPA: glycine--tRNA ligase subunit beta [Steroidobacteraceae bacterium]|jgi:glycyl-tRNA synthetase beta chain|nr:glycine--tRNA ligase subunit beta [Steroidobacteraceae bacterium]
MSSRDLLFELRTEELPPRSLPALSQALTEGIAKGIDGAGIAHGKIHGFATPRRLAVWVEHLSEHQPDRQIERRGPPLANSFDGQGAPTQAATAFAKSCGVAVGELSRFTTEKGAWLQYRGTERGAATTSLLGDILIRAVAALPIPKRMRWGSSSAEFVRPVHSVVLLYGDEVVPVEVLGLAAGRITSGHRFHSPKPIALKGAKGYESRLRRAKVVVDFAKRRELIRAGVTATAHACGPGCRALIDDALLDEVTALVEWPVPLAGQFEQRFLSLPREVVIATVQDHQRYFPVQGADGKLSGWFVTVSNIESRDPSKVREGNERVVRPRLSDAAFFWEQDTKIPLEQHAAKLAGMVFQAKLGSYADKTARVTSLAGLIGSRIGAGPDVKQAAELSKADLMSAMVGEFPELQGTMGRYYAQAQGLPQGVSVAIEEHYRPRYAGDAVPASSPGRAIALADKIDTLVGIFAIEQRPTGTKDPFGLRRAALGVLRILLEAGLDLDLADLLAVAAAAQPVQRAGVADEVYEFIAERLRGMLLEQPGTTAEMLDAVLANRPPSPLDTVMRLGALKGFLLLPDAGVLAAINKRIANILKKTTVQSDVVVDPRGLAEEAERGLHHALLNLRDPVLEASRQRRYADSLQALVGLRAPVNDFFERVMVMDEDASKRNNRLALLRDVQILLTGVADLSRLPG